MINGGSNRCFMYQYAFNELLGVLLNARIYHMALNSRVTYQNISPEVTRKPCRVMLPNAEGRG